MRFSLLPLVLLACTSAPDADKPYVQLDYVPPATMLGERMREYFPADLADYIFNYRLCRHLAGEDPRRVAADTALVRAQQEACINFDSVGAALEKRYSGDARLADVAAVIQIITDGDTAEYPFIWKDPDRRSVALNTYIEAQGQFVIASVADEMRQLDEATAKGDAKEVELLHFMLGVQHRSLDLLLRERERLHPVTRAGIEKLATDSVLLNRASTALRP